MSDEQTTQPNNDQPVADEKDKQIIELQAQAEEYLNGWKRAKADYLNLQKETAEKQKNILEFAHGALITEILPIYDHLKKAVSTLPADNSWAEGIKQIYKQFGDFLKQYGLTEIKTIGEKFNPEFHEAVVREKKEGVESDIIISEVSPGYLFKDKVFIPAKVVVAE